ncbi:MAG TPA: L-aspartate oxidase [Ktedonobacterales bacterium]|jgi:L-aspartate oxidase
MAGQRDESGAESQDARGVEGATERAPAPSDDVLTCDVAVIGGGVAGLSVALSLPPGLRVVLVTKAALGESNTRYAQGGLAAAVGRDDDPALHLRDTIVAGAGLVDEPAARVLVDEGPAAVAWLIAAGAQFDERGDERGVHAESAEPSAMSAEARVTPAGHDASLAARFALGHEAAHSRHRVLHAHGDATGAEIERALVAAVRARPGTTVLEHAEALDLIVAGGACQGVVVSRGGVRTRVRAARATVLANGGAGQLWMRTSNPAGATADGIGLAWRAGAVLADLAFVQFHPTVLVPPDGGGDAFLISEAVRGEGAHLLNAADERFMPRYHPDAELAPRDVVARAILSEMQAANAPSAFLDLRHLPAERVRERFPTIAAVCARYGLDLARDRIPVAPAAHYFMGGVAVDTWARTTVPGLYAVGEVACTGVHGANRLASNSLLEGLVFGRRAARAIAGSVADLAPAPTLAHPPLPGAYVPAGAAEVVTPRVREGDVAGGVRWALRHLMWDRVALLRDAAGLRAARAQLRALARGEPVDSSTANMLVAAQLIVASALARHESRGGHYRLDAPKPNPALAGRHTLVAGRGAATPTTVGAAAAAGGGDHD